jgi:hypothetical protein
MRAILHGARRARQKKAPQSEASNVSESIWSAAGGHLNIRTGKPGKLPPPKLRGAARQFALGRTRPLKTSVASSLGRPDSQISANSALFVFRIASAATRNCP